MTISLVILGRLAIRAPRAEAIRRAWVCESDLVVGQRTTLLSAMSCAIGAGGSSPLFLRGSNLSQNHLGPFGSSLLPKRARNLDTVWISAVGYDRHELARLDPETMLYNVPSSLS
jgi:hypothetical protein